MARKLLITTHEILTDYALAYTALLSLMPRAALSPLNAAGCDFILTVTVNALPVSSSTFQATTCAGTMFQYAGTALAVGQTQNFVFQNALGCDSVVTVTVSALPVWISTLNVSACPGSTFQYAGTNVAVGQTQSFVLQSSLGCDSTVTIAVTAWPELDFTVKTEISCPNIPTGTLAVAVTGNTGLSNSFSLNNVDFQTDTLFNDLPTGNYTVFVQDENGCIFEKTASIGSLPRLEVTLPQAFLLPCDSAAITLAPAVNGDTMGLHFTWWNGAHTPTVAASEGGPIWVEATNHCETVRREAVVTWADVESSKDFVYVPNVFSPDAKAEENRTFRSFFAQNIQLLAYHLEVYNRWGNFLFTSEVPEDGWAGLFRQKNPGAGRVCLAAAGANRFLRTGAGNRAEGRRDGGAIEIILFSINTENSIKMILLCGHKTVELCKPLKVRSLSTTTCVPCARPTRLASSVWAG